MKKFPLLIAVAALAGSVSMAASAAESKTPAEQEYTAAPVIHESAAMGAHSMSGTIEKIDHESGEIVLKSEPMNLTLHFPPASIKDLRQGQKIVVHLAFSIEE